MKLLPLFSLLFLLYVNVTYSSTYLPSFKKHFKRQTDDWVWEDVDSNESNDVYRRPRYPQFNNNNNDDMFIFDTSDPDEQNFNNNNNNNNPNQFFNEPQTTPIPVPGMGTTRSACEDTCLLTPQYNPVCGTDSVSYFSRERLFCAQRCGKDVQINHLGKCHRRAPVV